MILRFKNKNPGFTLIEVVVYVGILALLLVVLVNFITNLVKSNRKAEIHRKVWENADYATRRVFFEIENAKSVYYCSNCLTIFNDDAGQLDLETEMAPPSGETTTYVVLYRDITNSRLYIKREGFKKEAITSEDVEVTKFRLKGLNVVNNIPRSIQIEITIKQKGDPSNPAYTATTELKTTATIKR